MTEFSINRVDILPMARRLDSEISEEMDPMEIAIAFGDIMKEIYGFEVHPQLDEREKNAVIFLLRRALFLVIGEHVFDEAFLSRIRSIIPCNHLDLASVQDESLRLGRQAIYNDGNRLVNHLHQTMGMFAGLNDTREGLLHGQSWLERGYETGVTVHFDFADSLQALAIRDLGVSEDLSADLISRLYADNFAFILEAARKANIQHIDDLHVSPDTLRLVNQPSGAIRVRWQSLPFQAREDELHTSCPMAFSLRRKQPSAIWRLHDALRTPITKVFRATYPS